MVKVEEIREVPADAPDDSGVLVVYQKKRLFGLLNGIERIVIGDDVTQTLEDERRVSQRRGTTMFSRLIGRQN